MGRTFIKEATVRVSRLEASLETIADALYDQGFDVSAACVRQAAREVRRETPVVMRRFDVLDAGQKQ